MIAVRLTRAIPTHCIDFPAGSRFMAVYQGDLVANLLDDRGVVRVSCADVESFEEEGLGPRAESLGPAEEFTTETRSHGEEHEIKIRLCPEAGVDGAGEIEANDHRLLPPVPVEAGSPVLEAGTAKPAQNQQQIQLESVVGDGQSEPVSAGPQPATRVGDSPEDTARANSVLASAPPCLRGESSSVEECPFEPNAPSGYLPSATSHSPADPNAELSALAQRDPAPLVNREESIRLARLVPRVIEVSPTLSVRVRGRLAEFGYVLVDRDDRNYVPSKSQEEFTTEARRHGEHSRDVTGPRSPQTTQEPGDRVKFPAVVTCSDKEPEAGLNVPLLAAVLDLSEVSLGVPSVPPCLRGESFDWRQPLPAYEPNQIGWKLIGSRVIRVFHAMPEEPCL